MKKLAFLLCSMSIILVACDRNPPAPDVSGNQVMPEEEKAELGDQAETEADRQLLQSIHQTLKGTGDEVSSFRIIVSDGNVNLKGAVKADRDKVELEKKISNIEGVKNITSNIEVHP